jgi:hypothetical protein
LIDDKYKIIYTNDYLIIPKILLNFNYNSSSNNYRKIKGGVSSLSRKRKRANSKESQSSPKYYKKIQKNLKRSKLSGESYLLSNPNNNENNISIQNVSINSQKSNKDKNQCIICLDKINMPSKLIECEHIFCKECIEQWANKSSTCPLCKLVFKKIIYYDMRQNLLGEKKVKKKIFKHEEENDDQWLENTLEHCMNCKNTNDIYLMLVCDKCKFNVCHTYCAGLEMIPDEDWYCSPCQEEMKQSKNNKNPKDNKNKNKSNKILKPINNKMHNHKSSHNSKLRKSKRIRK